MNKTLPLLLIFLATQGHGTPRDSIKLIDSLLQTLYQQREFNGSILVAEDGQVLYSNGFGMANFEKGEKFTPGTSSCIASVTKQFTAMAIMMLSQNQRLSYDDRINKHLKLPEVYRDVTIRQLLTHTSGVIDYDHLGSGKPENLILRAKSLRFSPGQKYEYSNSNYVLLSLIVEKLSNQPFHDFLKKNIFDPLAMTRTFSNARQGQGINNVASGYNQFGKPDDHGLSQSFGDGGLYSTVEDLLKWSQALYTERLVKQSTLEEAFKPGVVSEGTSTYGFGWNITADDHGKYAWHTGNTAGFRAYIQRRLDKHRTIIILTNTGPSKRIEIAQAIEAILDHRSYVVPKRSAAKEMYFKYDKTGIDKAMAFYDSAMQHAKDVYDFSESELNLLGYQLLYGDRRVDDAVKVLELNAKLHPGSSNTFDSLSEAYLTKGDKASARKNYQRALEIDPGNINASNMLKKISP